MKFIKKFWAFILAGIAFLAGAMIAGRRVNPPIKPDLKPPDQVNPPDVVGDYDKQKGTSDATVDDMSRSDLISDINSRYGKPKSGG